MNLSCQLTLDLSSLPSALFSCFQQCKRTGSSLFRTLHLHNPLHRWTTFLRVLCAKLKEKSRPQTAAKQLDLLDFLLFWLCKPFLPGAWFTACHGASYIHFHKHTTCNNTKRKVLYSQGQWRYRRIRPFMGWCWRVARWDKWMSAEDVHQMSTSTMRDMNAFIRRYLVGLLAFVRH